MPVGGSATPVGGSVASSSTGFARWRRWGRTASSCPLAAFAVGTGGATAGGAIDARWAGAGPGTAAATVLDATRDSRREATETTIVNTVATSPATAAARQSLSARGVRSVVATGAARITGRATCATGRAT